jgi:hypothetical protein
VENGSPKSLEPGTAGRARSGHLQGYSEKRAHGRRQGWRTQRRSKIRGQVVHMEAEAAKTSQQPRGRYGKVHGATYTPNTPRHRSSRVPKMSSIPLQHPDAHSCLGVHT